MSGGVSPLPRRSREGEGRERAARRRYRSDLTPLTPAGVEDAKTDAVAIGEDIVVPEPQNAKSGAFQVSRAALVIGDLIGMLAPVDLDDETCIDTKEIQEIRPPRDLPLPPPTAEAMCAQSIPEPRLGAGVAASEFTRPRQSGDPPESAYGSHGAYGNICGTSVQASMQAPPSPYPLPLRFAGGEERAGRRRSLISPAQREGEGRERAARPRRISNLTPLSPAGVGP
jgi:hypothetical protein